MFKKSSKKPIRKEMTNHQLADFLVKKIDNLVIKTDRIEDKIHRLA